jgi:hypothetical protein
LESLPLSRQQPHPLSTCLEWSALMVSAQNGDRAAYRRLLTEIADLVRCWSRRYGIHGPACEELECNVLRTLHRLRHTYQPSRPFMPWLLAVLRYEARKLGYHPTRPFLRMTRKDRVRHITGDDGQSCNVRPTPTNL